MIRSLVLAGLTGAALLAGPAEAAVISIDSVTGVWTATAPGVPTVAGTGTEEIRWGQPATWRGRSGYRFDGAAPPAYFVDEGEQFELGTFTHFNNPIYGTSLTSATLEVTLDLTIDGVAGTIVSVFEFAHWETPNSARPCANGAANWSGVNRYGCADRVTFSLNAGASESLDIGGTAFLVDITGFETGGALADAFWTKEKRHNTATLRGVITSDPGPTSNPGPTGIPEPSTLAVLSVGLLGAGAVARRRKAA